ncbi:MAG: hypothetical protein AMJ58_04545 [Gammaproteobacteria bacterium SG8_30]|jgi:hypothetical protein|nr:MAG: hypothetical protein AMJ58_04545 [Gammaproteobacteria bacterium SG8_30]
MDRRLAMLIVTVAGLVMGSAGVAQINEVPMKGEGNDWVKELDLKGRMDWEWIETYTDEVYFATRQDYQRDGDIVTMWTRIEYRVPKTPGPYQSVASRDRWDCKNRRQANVSIVYYRWHNLEDNDPNTAVTSLESWDGVEPGSLGETLLEFACGLE